MDVIIGVDDAAVVAVAVDDSEARDLDDLRLLEGALTWTVDPPAISRAL